ncbi:Transporter, MscS family [Candidatus Sulfotelmatomonas gaucii]|uniref:Transporter, MscS family n=1 Tax=Candidatus Sulfuritelmatomonas gaucii TaxID=2043161 RepID=A0A2N9LLR5_9BACT|nr:Transporter, MscS family [Candidatus Sulfotelmatomonas gaucii]
MFRCLANVNILLAMRWGWFQEGRFMGKVLDEWIADSQEFLHTKLPRLIGIAIIAFVLSRLLRLVTFHIARAAERSGAGPARLAEVKTMSGVIRATGLAIIALIAGLQFLDAMGFDLAPLLASAGVAGIAIGLAAQNIVKDMFNGFLILVEGQFSVGDTVTIAGVNGVVEALTLRKTTVRDGNGILYIIPNSQITTVANLSAGYSVATIQVSVDFSANPDEVQALLTRIAMDVRNSEEFKNVFVADPQVLGIDVVKGSQMIFLVNFKTRATQQYGPMREFQRRVRLALEEHHMLPGDPNRVFTPSSAAASSGGRNQEMEPESAAQDPTTLKPQEANPFSGE